MPVTVSVITDEVSPELGAGLRFAAEQGLSTVDIRSIGGINFLSFEQDRQQAIACEIRDAGLKVGCFATPLLKWAAPGKPSGPAGDQFGFDAKGRSNAELYEAAFAAAGVLGTRNLRIFSLLTDDGFKLSDLEADFTALLKRAERHDMVLHVENEPVCNVRTVGHLVALMQAWRQPRLRALLDIGNAHAVGAKPAAAELTAVMPFVDQMHFKDYALAKQAYVAMGEGDIDYAAAMRVCFAGLGSRPLSLTIETHVPGDQPGATQRSLAAVRQLAAASA